MFEILMSPVIPKGKVKPRNLGRDWGAVKGRGWGKVEREIEKGGRLGGGGSALGKPRKGRLGVGESLRRRERLRGKRARSSQLVSARAGGKHGARLRKRWGEIGREARALITIGAHHNW